MAKEIERKYLVSGNAWRQLATGTHYRQGYLSTVKERTVRVRTINEEAFLTIKGITVGGLICNDMWANPQCTPMPDPHLSQQLSKMGARVIFVAINGGRNGSDWSEQVNWPYHEVNMRMRAVAGNLWVVSSDNCFPSSIPCSAPSGVLDPRGQWVAQAKREGEDVVVHTIRLQ